MNYAARSWGWLTEEDRDAIFRLLFDSITCEEARLPAVVGPGCIAREAIFARRYHEGLPIHVEGDRLIPEEWVTGRCREERDARSAKLWLGRRMRAVEGQYHGSCLNGEEW